MFPFIISIHISLIASFQSSARPIWIEPTPENNKDDVFFTTRVYILVRAHRNIISLQHNPSLRPRFELCRGVNQLTFDTDSENGTTFAAK